jgi:hypothetical protein
MADYYSLLTRAVSNLPRSSLPTARRAIYDRATAALVKQLRELRPPLPEADIAREKRALDEAITRLETESDPQARANPSAAPAPPRSFPDKIIPEASRTPPASGSVDSGERFASLDALEAEMSRLLGEIPLTNENDKAAPAAASAQIGEALHVFEEKLLKQPPPSPSRLAPMPAPMPDEKSKPVEPKAVVRDEAAIKIEIERYAARLRSLPAYADLQATLGKARALCAQLRAMLDSVASVRSASAGNADEASRTFVSMADAITGKVDRTRLGNIDDIEQSVLEHDAALRAEAYDIIRREIPPDDKDAYIKASHEEALAWQNEAVGGYYAALKAHYDDSVFQFTDLMTRYTNRTIERLSASAGDAALAATADAQAPDPATENRPEPGTAQKPRLPTDDEIAEILAHAESHQWKDRPVRRSVKPAARRFLRSTYARWLDAGIDIPTHIFKTGDAELYSALNDEIAETGLGDEERTPPVAEDSAAPDAESAPAPAPPPRPLPSNEALAAKTRRLQAALSADRAFTMPVAAPKPENAAEPRLPTEDEMTEIVEHGQAHPWKNRRVRRSAGPAAYAFFTETYAKWLKLGIEIPLSVVKKADGDLYERLHQEIGKSGMKAGLSRATP